MIRIGAQITFCSPERTLRRTAVELDEQNIVTKLFSLDDGNVETSHTQFYDGILSNEIVSVKQNIHGEHILNSLKEYQYYDLSEIHTTFDISKKDKPLLLDFGTNSPDTINAILPYLTQALDSYTIFEIIAACTYYPALLLGRQPGLIENSKAKVILWENVDLVQKKLLFNTCIHGIN